MMFESEGSAQPQILSQNSKEARQIQELKRIFQTYGGNVGQDEKIRSGILIQDYFATIDYRGILDPEDTTTVRLGSGEYKTKQYRHWIVGNITLIPLESYSNNELDFLDQDMPDLNCKLFLFSNIDGNTQVIHLKMEEKKIKYVVKQADSFSIAERGSPIMTFVQGKPAVCCLLNYQLVNLPIYGQYYPKSGQNSHDQPKKDFGVWTSQFNLLKKYIQKMIDLKKEIIQKSEVIIKQEKELYEKKEYMKMLQEELVKQAGPRSNSTIIFHSYRLSTSISQESSNKHITLQSKNQQSPQFSIRQVNPQNQLDITEISQNFSSLKDSAKHQGYYSTDNARRKFTKLSSSHSLNRQLLRNFVKRAYYNMKYVASWNIKRHLLTAKSIKKEYRDGEFGFSYETVKCQCGCNQRQDQHAKIMQKLALDTPLLFFIALLDAYIQLEEHSLMHNDIKFCNFIYYEGDFLLGDFDLSCFVKDINQMKNVKDETERKLFRLNLQLIDISKLVKHHMPKDEGIDLFIIHTQDYQVYDNDNDLPEITLSKVKQTISKSHQYQFIALVNDMKDSFNIGKTNLTEEYFWQIDIFIKMFGHKEIQPIVVYIKIITWARERLDNSALQTLRR